MKAPEKTNATRALAQKKIPFKEHIHELPAETPGAVIAETLGQDKARVYKTLVTVSPRSGQHYVFMVPVADELDLKKAAKAAGEKSVEMIKAKELLPLTGYVHGGCSPLGMKKQFPTFIHLTAAEQPQILCSGGRVGLQIELSLDDLCRLVPIKTADITADD